MFRVIRPSIFGLLVLNADFVAIDHRHLLSMTITRNTQLCWARILRCYPGCYHPCKMTYRIHSIKPRIFQVGIKTLNRHTSCSFIFLCKSTGGAMWLAGQLHDHYIQNDNPIFRKMSTDLHSVLRLFSSQTVRTMSTTNSRDVVYQSRPPGICPRTTQRSLSLIINNHWPIPWCNLHFQINWLLSALFLCCTSNDHSMIMGLVMTGGWHSVY